MRILFLFVIVVLASCRHNDVASTEKEGFKPIPYSSKHNYTHAIAKKIVPDVKLQYWAYISVSGGFSEYDTRKITVIKEEGDKFFRSYTDSLPKRSGFYKGVDSLFWTSYVLTVKNDSVHYIYTKEALRDFIGRIDNLEEAMILASTYDYFLGDTILSAAYRKVNDNYEMHLIKAPDRFESWNPKSMPVEVIVTPDGFIKTKRLGTYGQAVVCH